MENGSRRKGDKIEGAAGRGQGVPVAVNCHSDISATGSSNENVGEGVEHGLHKTRTIGARN